MLHVRRCVRTRRHSPEPLRHIDGPMPGAEPARRPPARVRCHRVHRLRRPRAVLPRGSPVRRPRIRGRYAARMHRCGGDLRRPTTLRELVQHLCGARVPVVSPVSGRALLHVRRYLRLHAPERLLPTSPVVGTHAAIDARACQASMVTALSRNDRLVGADERRPNAISGGSPLSSVELRTRTCRSRQVE